VGVSGGLVTVSEDFNGEITPNSILKLADDRLYMGKNKGKGVFIGDNDDIL
jgi:PleD family two-component response regulator